MTLVVVVVVSVGLVLGLLAGWWIGSEVGRGMPWGFFVLALALPLGCVAAPVVLPSLLHPLAAAALYAFGGGILIAAPLAVTIKMEDVGPREN